MKSLVLFLSIALAGPAFAHTAIENFTGLCQGSLGSGANKKKFAKADVDKYCECYGKSLAASCGSKCDKPEEAMTFSYSDNKAIQKMDAACMALRPKKK